MVISVEHINIYNKPLYENTKKFLSYNKNLKLYFNEFFKQHPYILTLNSKALIQIHITL